MFNHDQPNKQLDPEAEKRLSKLMRDWDKKPTAFFSENLHTQDLRLLLEHFTPLQDLIKQIAYQQPLELNNADSAENDEKLQAALLKIEETKAQLDKALTLVNKITQESEGVKNLYETAGQKNKVLEERLNTTEQQLNQCQLLLSQQSTDLKEINFLRAEPKLVQHLDLGSLPSDNTQALIQIVAVLSQKDNLERLWLAFKERCETEKRAVNANELMLLKTALSWYNHNWRTRPFQLIEVSAGSSYNFEKHQKSLHSPNGEIIYTLLLPGLVDGSGKPLCKTLVSTH